MKILTLHTKRWNKEKNKEVVVELKISDTGIFWLETPVSMSGTFIYTQSGFNVWVIEEIDEVLGMLRD